MRFVQLASGIVVAWAALASHAAAQQFSDGSQPGLFSIFDEARFGAVYPVQSNDDSGVILSGQLFFRNFVPPYRNYFANALFRPRVHIGGNLAAGSDPINQAYIGLTWDFPVLDRYFIEASLGGTIHDGPLETPGDGIDLGCSWLFREAVAVGANLTDHWRIVASADHSSHADLCNDGKAGNSGITHAGVYVGYRF